MAEWYDNELIIVGSIRQLARYKRKARGSNPPGSMDMANIVPLGRNPNAEVDRRWGCSRICESKISFAESANGFGALQFNFKSAWAPPIEFVRRASKLFPELEFHLKFNAPQPDDVTLDFIAGDHRSNCEWSYCDKELYLGDYQNRPRPDPWAGGLFENSDAPKPDGDPGAADPAAEKDSA